MTSLYANAYDFEVDNIYYNILSNNPHEVEVTYKFNYWYAPNSYSGDVVIPSTITYSGVTYHVTAIGDEAFSGDGHYVKSVTMPNSITAIGKKAFSSLWDITSILIPSSVLTIDDEAFEDCQKLESIDIPENVTSIGEKAFDYCLALKTVTLHNSLEIIGESAFARCGELKSINLPTSLKSIGSHAFSECSKLNTITIPPYVNTIGTHAFWGCSGLSLVISEIENPFTIDDTVFELWEGYHTPSIHQTLQIPHSTRDKYMQYSGWTKYFSEIKESTAYYSFSIKSSGNGSVAYNSDNIKNGSKTYSLEEGTNVSLSFNPDNGYRIKSIKVNDSDITSSVSNNQYVTTINANTTVEVEFEAIPPITYTLSIKATGNGSASYSGETIRGTTKTYTVNEGTSVTLSFTPDTGYRIKSLKVNGSAVTASTSYTTTVNANTTVEVEFEAIPPTTYTLSIKATGNGSASYSGETIKGTTKTYTVNEGTSVTLSFTPDTGYRIKSLKVNGSAVTASTSYTITINANTTIEVEFEAIPPTTYTLSIKSTGNGSASYNGETIKSTTKTYTVNEGTSVTISFTPDTGYRIKSLKVNGSAVTASTSYTITINANTTIEVEFEAIPPTTYTLSIKSTGNGSASYNGETIKSTTKTYTVNEGTSVTISFTPDTGYRIKSLKVNSSAVTASNSYTTTVNANTTIEVEFEAIPPTTYTLSIKSTGNGSASYSGETIKSTTKTYTVNEGTSVTISFTPDTGYRIKSLKVNNSAVTASNSYTTTVNANTTVEVEFEAIPPTTYTLSIKATGNGSASYSGETIKGTTKTYTVNEGTSVTISFTPDTGYRIKSLKVNNSAVTASNSYTTTVNANTTVEVEFEAIPPTTYTLSIKATGNGSASYSGETIKGTTKTYTVNEGTSVSISFTPDSGYRIKSLKVNGSAVTASTSYTTTVNANTTIEVEFEAIPPTTYTLSIKSTGNGSASYNGETIKGTTKTYTINEGTSVTISFTPDSGYRIKSLKVNGSAVTASNSYTTTVNANTTVEVEFEAIPEDPTPTPTPKTYTLSIKSTGNGSALYSGETIKGTTKTYTVNEGTSVTISFTPDTGYRIKSLKVNGSAVTASTSYTTTVNANTTIEVEFEAIPDDPTPTPTPKTYTLSIKSSGNGSASYDGGTIRETTKKYTIDEGTSVTITFTPDTGNRIKSLKVNGSDVTVSDKYKVTINADTSVEVAFEEIPITTYTLLIIVTGNGSASYNGETIRETTKNYTIDEGTSVAIAFTPDTGNRIKSLKVNGSDVTVSDSYKATINADTSVEVAFEKLDDAFAVDGLNYQVVSFDEHTVMLGAGDYGLTLEVPEAITYQGEAWTVDGIDADALAESAELAAVIWHPAAKMTAKVSNPNLLLYVKDEALAPSDVKNVVVNGFARSVTLTDAQSGNNFYCPEAFTVQSIVYQHSYGMKTGMNESRGWETIALPFDVQVVSHVSKGEIVPFANWTSGNDAHPFWLYELSASGFREATAIKANTPYIISMPNNSQYVADYQLSGRITFSATNAIVNKSDNVQAATYSNRTFVPNFISREANAGYYALNVNNDYDSYQGGDNEGSKFILNLRRIHPFEAYMTSTANTRSIDIFDSMITAIRGIADLTDSNRDIRVYDLSGKLVMSGLSIETIRQQLPKGVYIINNRKMIIK